jgi:hypothetical protein
VVRKPEVTQGIRNAHHLRFASNPGPRPRAAGGSLPRRNQASAIQEEFYTLSHLGIYFLFEEATRMKAGETVSTTQTGERLTMLVSDEDNGGVCQLYQVRLPPGRPSSPLPFSLAPDSGRIRRWLETYCSRSKIAGSTCRARLTGPATETDPVSSTVHATAASTNGSWADAW